MKPIPKLTPEDLKQFEARRRVDEERMRASDETSVDPSGRLPLIFHSFAEQDRGIDRAHSYAYSLASLMINLKESDPSKRIPLDLKNPTHQKVLTRALFIQQSKPEAIAELPREEQQEILALRMASLDHQNAAVRLVPILGMIGVTGAELTGDLVSHPGLITACFLLQKIFQPWSVSPDPSHFPAEEIRHYTQLVGTSEGIREVMQILREHHLLSDDTAHELLLISTERGSSGLNQELAQIKREDAAFLQGLEGRTQTQMRESASMVLQKIHQLTTLFEEERDDQKRAARFQQEQIEFHTKLQNFQSACMIASTVAHIVFKKPKVAFAISTLGGATIEVVKIAHGLNPSVLALGAVGGPILSILAVGASVLSSYQSQKAAKAQAKAMQAAFSQLMKGIQAVSKQIHQVSKQISQLQKIIIRESDLAHRDATAIQQQLTLGFQVLEEHMALSQRQVEQYLQGEFYISNAGIQKIQVEILDIKQLLDKIKQEQSIEHYAAHLEHEQQLRLPLDLETEKERHKTEETLKRLEELLVNLHSTYSPDQTAYSSQYQQFKKEFWEAWKKAYNSRHVYTLGKSDAMTQATAVLGDQMDSTPDRAARNAEERIHFLLTRSPSQKNPRVAETLKHNRETLRRFSELLISFLSILEWSQDHESKKTYLASKEVSELKDMIHTTQVLAEDTLASQLPALSSAYLQEVRALKTKIEQITQEERDDTHRAKRRQATEREREIHLERLQKQDGELAIHRAKLAFTIPGEQPHGSGKLPSLEVILTNREILEVTESDVSDVREFQKLVAKLATDKPTKKDEQGPFHSQINGCAKFLEANLKGHHNPKKVEKEAKEKYPDGYAYLTLEKKLVEMIKQKTKLLEQKKLAVEEQIVRTQQELSVVRASTVDTYYGSQMTSEQRAAIDALQESESLILAKQRRQLLLDACSISSELFDQLKALDEAYCLLQATRAYCLKDQFEVLMRFKNATLIETSHDFLRDLQILSPFNVTKLLEHLQETEQWVAYVSNTSIPSGPMEIAEIEYYFTPLDTVHLCVGETCHTGQRGHYVEKAVSSGSAFIPGAAAGEMEWVEEASPSETALIPWSGHDQPRSEEPSTVGSQYSCQIKSDQGLPILQCSSENSTVYILLKSVETPIPDHPSNSQSAESYEASSCRSIEFYGQPSVVCDGEKTTLVYTPHYSTLLWLENLNAQLLLGQVLVHWLKKVCQSLTGTGSKTQSDPHEELQDPGSSILMTREKSAEQLTEIEKELNRIASSLDQWPQDQKSEIKWAVWAIEDYREDLQTLQRKAKRGALTQRDLNKLCLDILELHRELDEVALWNRTASHPVPTVSLVELSDSTVAAGSRYGTFFVIQGRLLPPPPESVGSSPALFCS